MQPQQPMYISSAAPGAKPSRKKLFIIVGSVMAILLVGVLIWKLTAGNTNGEDLPPANVTLTTQGVTPATIKVKKGQGVTWINEDSRLHQITGDEGLEDLHSAESLEQGDSYTYPFDKTGTFTYHDPLMPNEVKGTVIVE